MIKLGGLIDLKPITEADVFTATSKETGTTSVFKSKAARDAAIKAGTHEKRKDDKDGAVKDPTDKPKVNIFNKDKAAKGGDSSAGQKDKDEPKSSAPKLDKDGDGGMSSDTAISVKDYLNKELGLDGSVDLNSGGAIEYMVGDSRNAITIGNDEIDGKPFSVSLSDIDTGEDNDTYKSFDNQEDAVAYAKELGQKLKGGKEEPKDDSDNLSQPNSVKGTGQADPKVNKAVRKAAQKAGITPQKLGKEEYEKKMAQAAYEALTDANFHTEARWLVADLEGKPELREKPNYPSIDDKDYDKKIDAIRSKYASQYADNVDDDAYELGVKSSQESGWAGATAIEGLVYDLKMNGSHKLANTILKSFKDASSSRNEGRLKLGNLLPEGKHKKLERDLKNLAGVAKIDFSEALESLEEDGVLEAMDHLDNLMDRIKDVHKQLKRKS
tara:strand:- start:269 stop:1588 length:1320 start_codon:yes stop_codon:yes gene_type:complete